MTNKTASYAKCAGASRYCGRRETYIGQVQAAAHAALAAAQREHGANVAHYGVLALLDEQPELSNADLAHRAFVTPQSMNQILRELEDTSG